MTSTSTAHEDTAAAPPANSATRVATASFIGTAIEFYDFYVYATAAALVIGPVFFPQTSGTAQMLSSFLTFGIAFLARPLGSALFGHFGDRIGRKSTLVASLLLMGICTTLIGVLPGYATIGAWAPILLCVLRFGQGLGLGGEWGGAALLATEDAPKGKRAWFGMFPQLGPSIGFLAANGLFLPLAMTLSDEQFRAWGWRIPFLLSALLVMVGLYVRLKLEETPVFAKAMARQERFHGKARQNRQDATDQQDRFASETVARQRCQRRGGCHEQNGEAQQPQEGFPRIAQCRDTVAQGKHRRDIEQRIAHHHRSGAQQHWLPVIAEGFHDGHSDPLMTSHGLGENRGLFQFQAYIQPDHDQQGAEQKRNPPAPGTELLVA